MSQDKPSRLDVYLQEYDKLKDEQTSRIGFRDNLLYVTLITIGGILSFAFANDSGYKLYALLTSHGYALFWAGITSLTTRRFLVFQCT